MAEIKLARIDFRLIHGQVITRWLKQTNAGRIIVIDDKLASDPFMSQVYVMAAPPGIKVEMLSVEDAVNGWQKNQLGKQQLLVLFKTVNTAFETIEKGMKINELQIGGLGAGPGRKLVYNQVTLNTEDGDALKKIQTTGIRVYFQTVPEETPAELDKILKTLSNII